jgi:hypothetical protein
MAEQTRNTLKGWFQRGMKPTAAQFADWIDSFLHKTDKLPISAVNNLQELLNGKASTEQLNNKQDANSNNLQTESKNVIDAINETAERVGTLETDVALIKQNTLRNYTLDFSSSSELVQDFVFADAHILQVAAKNVYKLYMSYGEIVRQEVLISAANIIIPANTCVVWEIERITDGALAAVGIQYEVVN